MKRYIFGFLFIVIAAVVFYQRDKQKRLDIVKKTIEHHQKYEDKDLRKPASIAPVIPQAPVKAEKNNQIKEISDAADLVKKVEESILNEFLTPETQGDVEVQIQQMIQGKGQSPDRALILVKTTVNGIKSSYNASVDAKTGKILRKWNQTQFEKSPIKKINL